MKEKGMKMAKFKEFSKKESLDKTFPKGYLKSQSILLFILIVSPIFHERIFSSIIFYTVIVNGVYIAYKYLSFRVDGRGEV
ncbi:MAG: hypothetical protein ACRCWG_02275 [Sarcina sp.]